MPVTINGTSTAVIPNASGNVGVGTASPNATGWGRAITVNGAASTNGAVELTENGTLRGYMSYSVGGGLNVYAAAGQSLSLGSNATEAVRINTAGYVTKPYTPAFSVTGPYSGNVNPISAAVGGGYVVLWQTVILNNSSSYSVSTGRFTAPVAGMYYFSASLTNSDNSSGPYIQIRKNGSFIALAISYGTSYNGSATSAAVQLAVNDYVDVFFGAFNSSAAIDVNYSNFCGFLIG